MELVLDKAVIKDALRELIREEPATFRTIFREILHEDADSNSEFERLIQQNFKRFEATFKALA